MRWMFLLLLFLPLGARAHVYQLSYNFGEMKKQFEIQLTDKQSKVLGSNGKEFPLSEDNKKYLQELVQDILSQNSNQIQMCPRQNIVLVHAANSKGTLGCVGSRTPAAVKLKDLVTLMAVVADG